MTTLKLKYRLVSIIGLLALSIIFVSVISWMVILFYEKYHFGTSIVIFPFLVLTTLLLTVLILVFRSLKNISITENWIEYSYTLFPFQTFRLDRHDIDGIAVVMEKRKSVVGALNIPILFSFPDKEAVWIFTDKKFHFRISSMIYENYQEMKISLQDINELNVKIDTSMEQLLFMTRLKKLE